MRRKTLSARQAADTDIAPSRANAALRLGEIPRHLLRVGCRGCGRTVQKVDAIRLYGEQATWKTAPGDVHGRSCCS